MDPRPVRMALPSTPCVDAPSGQRAAQRVGGRAKRASRSRARWKKKGCLSAALSSRGDDHRTHPSNDLHPPHRESPGETSPSVEGLPRQGRGEAGKGRGPRVATQRVGRRAKRASCPAPDKRKGLPFGSPFLLSGGEGGSLSHTTPKTLAAQDLAPEAPAQGVQGSVHVNSPPAQCQVAHLDHSATHIPPVPGADLPVNQDLSALTKLVIVLPKICRAPTAIRAIQAVRIVAGEIIMILTHKNTLARWA